MNMPKQIHAQLKTAIKKFGRDDKGASEILDLAHKKWKDLLRTRSDNALVGILLKQRRLIDEWAAQFKRPRDTLFQSSYLPNVRWTIDAVACAEELLHRYSTLELINEVIMMETLRGF